MFRAIFVDHIGLKILSIFIAAFLWFYVAIVQNPATELTLRNVPVIVANASDLENRNLALLSKITTTINITLKGPRTILTQIKENGVPASVDVSAITAEGKYTLPITLEIPDSTVSVQSQSETEVVLEVEQYIKKQITLTIKTIGEPAEGFTADKPVANVTTITVEGPQSEVKLVDNAYAEISVAGKSADITQNVEIKLRSSNLVELDKTKYTISKDNVEIKVAIKPIQAEAPAQ